MLTFGSVVICMNRKVQNFFPIILIYFYNLSNKQPAILDFTKILNQRPCAADPYRVLTI
jgi:hypothetical protein